MDSTATVTEVDVAIVGGAMVGASLALGLANMAKRANQPLRIALIEAHQHDTSHPGFDARAIAVAHGSIFSLKQLEIWPKLAPLVTPIKDIHISDRGHFGMTELNSEQLKVDAFGAVLELHRAGQVLHHALTAQLG